MTRFPEIPARQKKGNPIMSSKKRKISLLLLVAVIVCGLWVSGFTRQWISEGYRRAGSPRGVCSA
jgi:hypothetical protein